MLSDIELQFFEFTNSNIIFKFKSVSAVKLENCEIMRIDCF